MKRYLATDRLFLRNLLEADCDTIFDYRNNKQCYQYQRWDDSSYEAVQAYIARHSSDTFLSVKEEQHYAISDKGNALIGELAYFHNEEDNCITLGITISYRHQRKGYAFETLSRVIEEIRKVYPQLDIVGLIDRENAASIGLFEKLGFFRECYAESVSSYVYTLPSNPGTLIS